MITNIKFVSIPVSDQERALDFYVNKLGFKVHTDQPFDDEQRWIELRIGQSQTRVVLFTAPGQEDRIGSAFNGAVACDNVEGTYRQLCERGVEFTTPPTKQDWGTFAMLKDPDGNEFVLSSQT